MSRIIDRWPGGARAVVALGVTLVCPVAVHAQQDASVEEIVVLGKALEELRVRIENAEDVAYARFNEINSDDRFDVYCYERHSSTSQIERRSCLSNAWREADATFADATVRSIQSGAGGVGSFGYSHIPQQYRAQQLRERGLVVDEMRRLSEEDPDFKAAMMRLGEAYQALEAVAGPRPEWTLYREVDTRDESLPLGSRRFDVRVGSAPWRHPLTARTFTIAGVGGRIRDVRVECEATEAELEYQADVDWTIPQAWGACTVQVSAKRGTTFALYELQ